MLVSQDKLKIWLEVARLGFFNFTLYIAHQLNIFGIFIWEELFSDLELYNSVVAANYLIFKCSWKQVLDSYFII